MRVILAAVAFSVLSFLAGVAGDLSIAPAPALAAPPPAAAVRLSIPSLELIQVAPAAAATRLRRQQLSGLAETPALAPKAHFALSTEELAAAARAKAPGKAA